jgi:hypothetical protein
VTNNELLINHILLIPIQQWTWLGLGGWCASMWPYEIAMRESSRVGIDPDDKWNPEKQKVIPYYVINVGFVAYYEIPFYELSINQKDPFYEDIKELFSSLENLTDRRYLLEEAFFNYLKENQHGN